MLRLFQSLFGAEPLTQGRYPDAAVREGLDLALTATDARISTLPDYEDKLRPAVLNALDRVVALVDALPPPIDLTRANYSTEPRLGAFFASLSHMQQVIREDAVLADYLAGPEGRGAGEAYALLMTRRSERNVLGMELQGEVMRREVAQVAVSFDDHQLLGPAQSIEASRQNLYRRTYNTMLEQALERIANINAERSDLKRQRELLQRKLTALEAGSWGLEGDNRTQTSVVEVEGQIAEFDQQIQGMGADSGVLEVHLDILCEILNNAEKQLWFEPVHLITDRMGIKRDAAGENNIELHLQELKGVRGRTAIAQMVRIPRDEFPQRPDFLAEAERLLG